MRARGDRSALRAAATREGGVNTGQELFQTTAVFRPVLQLSSLGGPKAQRYLRVVELNRDENVPLPAGRRFINHEVRVD